MLDDDTVGTVNEDTIDGDLNDFIGETLNVHLRDENGNPIEKTGKIVEILDEENI
ncbi:hypothetical protein [Dickeya poaceiphila]|uniref:hypothetical protein n=1 Tax=Dickeya poaceiphila TaxID=568768 RepID=UPI0003A38E08|nr:hypothetical protein [Dickeya poaceiphila]